MFIPPPWEEAIFCSLHAFKLLTKLKTIWSHREGGAKKEKGPGGNLKGLICPKCACGCAEMSTS